MDRLRGYTRLESRNHDADGRHGAIEMKDPRATYRDAPPPPEGLAFRSDIPDHGDDDAAAGLSFRSEIPPHNTAAAAATPARPLDTRWNPPFLRRWVCAAFAVFFVATIAGLQAVYSVSQRDHGLASSDSNLHYLWTYGPTAVFVAVTVLFRQVDYAAKAIQPWAEMAKGPQTARDSLLLDYVTPMHVVTLWRAARKRHVTVMATIIAFLFIKLITIFSTALFSLQSIPRAGQPTPMLVNETLSAAGLADAAAVDSRAAYIVYGHQAYNVNLPLGTTDWYATPAFAPKRGFVNGTIAYTAPVDVVSASLDCQSGTISYETGFLDSDQAQAGVSAYYNTTVSLPGCHIFNAVLQAPDWYYVGNDSTTRRGYRASFQNVTCSNLPADDPTSRRYMIAATYNEGHGQDQVTMLNSSNLVCIPTFARQAATVAVDALGHVQAVNVTGPAPPLGGLTGTDVADGVLASLKKSISLVVANDDLTLDAFTALMQGSTPDFHAAQLLDPSYLNQTGGHVYGQLAAQVAKLYLMTPAAPAARAQVEGTLTQMQNRLVARGAPVRIIQGISGAIVLLMLVVAATAPRGVVPRAVDSIAAVAAIMARSKALETTLRGTGHLTLDEIATILAPHRYATRLAHDDGGARSFSVHMTSSTGTEIRELSAGRDDVVKWIHPFILRRVAICLTMLAAAAAVVALEVLLAQSQRHDGLGTVSGDAATRYSWLYVPVLVFVLLGTLFNMMDFEIEFSESYHALAKGYCNARSSMLWFPLRHISLHATWNGLRHSRFALTAASVSAVLAPFLTIVVSGLFFTQATVATSPAAVTAVNWFNSTTDTVPATSIPALVIEGNLSYPLWTYGELALPQMRLADNAHAPSGSELQSGSLTVTTPAIRAAVSCEVVPHSRYLDVSVQDGTLTTNISTPDGCGNQGLITGPAIWLTNTMPVPDNAAGYFGGTQSLGMAAHCPTVALYYGHVASNRVERFAAIFCTQGLERVDASVEFDLPGFGVSHEPAVNGTATPFSDFYVQQLALQVLNFSTTSDQLDDTFNALVYGQDGVPTADLLNHTTLIDAYTHVYRQYMAQIVSVYLRANFSTLQDTPLEKVATPLSATHNNPNTFRLLQSAVSTHILVGVLVALLVCAVTIFVTVDMHNVLPKPMGSLAAVASLLAGSRIVDETSGLIPRGSEFWSDADWEKSGIWDGELFRMGWWDKFQEPTGAWAVSSPTSPARGRPDDAGFGEDLDDDGRPSFNGGFRIDSRPKVVA